MVWLPVTPNVRAQTDAAFATEVARFNELLAKAAADLDEPRSPSSWPRPPPSYDVHADTYDGTHPDESGEHKIAAAFAEAMYQAWDLGEPYAE